MADKTISTLDAGGSIVGTDLVWGYQGALTPKDRKLTIDSIKTYIANNLPAIVGGSGSGDDISISGTSHGTPGFVLLNQAGGNVGINKASPTEALDVTGNILGSGTIIAVGNIQTSGNVIADTLAEKTADNGVVIDGTKIKDKVIYFDSVSGGNGYLSSTEHATKGKIFIGSAGNSAYDEVNDRLGIGINAPGTIFDAVVSGTPDTVADANMRFVKSGSASDNNYISIQSGNTGLAGILLGDNDDGGRSFLYHNNNGNILHLKNAGVGIEINASGFIGQGEVPSGYMYTYRHTATTGTIFMINFTDGDGHQNGYISCDAAANTTAYNTSSDKRLKENIEDIKDSVAILKKLKPRKFNFKASKNKIQLSGFIAQEVKPIIPEAVTGDEKTKDPVNGEIIYMGIDYGKFTPYLWSICQEQQKTIENLDTRLKQLEGS